MACKNPAGAGKDYKVINALVVDGLLLWLYCPKGKSQIIMN